MYWGCHPCALSWAGSVLNISPHHNSHLEMRIIYRGNEVSIDWGVSEPQFVFLPITAGMLDSEHLGWGPSEWSFSLLSPAFVLKVTHVSWVLHERYKVKLVVYLPPWNHCAFYLLSPVIVTLNYSAISTLSSRYHASSSFSVSRGQGCTPLGVS